MTAKHKIIFFLQFFLGISVYAQLNYLGIDYSAFELKHNSNDTSLTIPSGKMTRFGGTFIGESFHLALNRYNTLGIGLGLTTIDYERQWVGIFRESNQPGGATVKGSVKYLSLPFTLSVISGTGLRYKVNRSPVRFGVNITYVPSFQTKNSFSVKTFGTADSSVFFSNYRSGAKEVQHSFTMGLCTQFLLFNKKIKFGIEPYFGFGTGYFNEKQGSSNFTYGLKLQMAIQMPKVTITKQIKRPGNYNNKKKELDQKQKEIEQQLNQPH